MRLGLITRCWNDPYVNEFVNHYINEGVDAIYIIDDRSGEGLYQDVSQCLKVHIVTDIIFRAGPELNILYQRIKADFDWIVVVDMDEYITTKKNIQSTLREELLTTFKDADCVKIPWVMMAFNGIEQNPDCLLETNIYRMDHDEKHYSFFWDRFRWGSGRARRKFRCRYKEIEVKCVFKTKSFDQCWDHGPERDDIENVKIVEGVYNQAAELDPYYKKLRELDISQAFLLCFHYRAVSKQHCVDKLIENCFDDYKHIESNDLILSDFPEIIDNTLCLKSKQRPDMLKG